MIGVDHVGILVGNGEFPPRAIARTAAEASRRRGRSFHPTPGERAQGMTNLLAQAINCDDPDRASKIIQDALGIESDDVVNYCFPKEWPADRERCARIIGTWLQTEARYLAS